MLALLEPKGLMGLPRTLNLAHTSALLERNKRWIGRERDYHTHPMFSGDSHHVLPTSLNSEDKMSTEFGENRQDPRKYNSKENMVVKQVSGLYLGTDWRASLMPHPAQPQESWYIGRAEELGRTHPGPTQPQLPTTHRISWR